MVHVNDKRRVVVVGGGFGGLAAVRALRKHHVDVTLVDRTNHHLFQPLLYQVAMAGLAAGEIAVPIRGVLRDQANARVLLAEVTGVDLVNRRIETVESLSLDYDFLVVATGAQNSYFGHDGWSAFAPGLKDIDDAIEIRRRVLLAFEKAEREPDPSARRKYLTFVIIGGGPTGVELAGAIAELATFVLAKDFRTIDPDTTRVVLVEGGERILATFAPELSKKAAASLGEMKVEVKTATRVTAIDADGVVAGNERIAASTVLWAAGVRASPLTGRMGLVIDRAGRAVIQSDCSIPDHPEVFVIGDTAAFTPDGATASLPGVSPVAMQHGRFVARQIARSLRGQPRERFHYRDKGAMATIGRSRAIAEVGRLRLSGFVAWLAWLLVHIFYLVDYRNRVLVILNWVWAYFAYRRGSRLITGARRPPPPGVPQGDDG